MTGSPSSVSAHRSPGLAGLARRIWEAPLVAHLIVLLGVLVVGLALTAPRVAYSSDEAAALVQARQLEAGAGWHYRYPLASIDAEDAARPFVRADAGTKGVAPYAKHPLYPVLLAGAIRLGGEDGVSALGLAATVAAALVAALSIRLLDPRLDRVALWLVGFGSPLLFDTYLVLAHGLAAAAAGLAALAAMTTVGQTGSAARRIAGLSVMVVALAAAAMLRTEAVFLGPSFAVAAAILVAYRRLAPVRGSVLGVLALAGSGAGWLIDHELARAIVGRAFPGVPNVAPSSWFAGRVDALQATWFTASYGGDQARDFLLVVGVVLLTVGAVVIRRNQGRTRLVVGLMIAAAACYVTRAIVGPPGAIPGLVIAFPVGCFLLWSMGPRVREGVRAPMMAGVALISTVAVLVTEYAIGGGVEWGGRYFAFILPIAIPVLLVGAAAAIERQPADVRTIVIVSLTVVSVVMAVLALQSIRYTHVLTARLLDGIQGEAEIAGSSGGLDRPVVISSNRLLPQLASRDFERYEWVVPDPVNLGRYSDRLVEAGVRRAVLVSNDPAADLSAMPGWQIVSRAIGPPEEVVVIEHD
jgi:hypothetical protein